MLINIYNGEPSTNTKMTSVFAITQIKNGCPMNLYTEIFITVIEI